MLAGSGTADVVVVALNDPQVEHKIVSGAGRRIKLSRPSIILGSSVFRYYSDPRVMIGIEPFGRSSL
jgi:hypothetical protein